MFFKPPGRSAISSTLHLLTEGVRDARSCLCLTSPAVNAQGNRFTCPGGNVDVAPPLPASVTTGLVCYTGAANAMPIGATANLGAFTSHNVTDFLQVAGAHSLFVYGFDVLSSVCECNAGRHGRRPGLMHVAQHH